MIGNALRHLNRSFQCYTISQRFVSRVNPLVNLRKKSLQSPGFGLLSLSMGSTWKEFPPTHSVGSSCWTDRLCNATSSVSRWCAPFFQKLHAVCVFVIFRQKNILNEGPIIWTSFPKKTSQQLQPFLRFQYVWQIWFHEVFRKISRLLSESKQLCLDKGGSTGDMLGRLPADWKNIMHLNQLPVKVSLFESPKTRRMRPSIWDIYTPPSGGAVCVDPIPPDLPCTVNRKSREE